MTFWETCQSPGSCIAQPAGSGRWLHGSLQCRLSPTRTACVGAEPMGVSSRHAPPTYQAAPGLPCGVVWRGAAPASGGARGGQRPRSHADAMRDNAPSLRAQPRAHRVRSMQVGRCAPTHMAFHCGAAVSLPRCWWAYRNG